MSLRQLEAATGISNGYLSQIESGRVGPPSAKLIRKLSSALAHPFFELMSAAGFLPRDSYAASGEYLSLQGTVLPLDDLTADEQQKLLDFVYRLKARDSDQSSHP